jgi:hypothetical protein
VQLASETLVLREQLMRNKLDSRTVGAALLATQEELKAAFNREQACEEGYNALLAQFDSCRVSQEASGQPSLRVCCTVSAFSTFDCSAVVTILPPMLWMISYLMWNN